MALIDDIRRRNRSVIDDIFQRNRGMTLEEFESSRPSAYELGVMARQREEEQRRLEQARRKAEKEAEEEEEQRRIEEAKQNLMDMPIGRDALKRRAMQQVLQAAGRDDLADSLSGLPSPAQLNAQEQEEEETILQRLFGFLRGDEEDTPDNDRATSGRNRPPNIRDSGFHDIGGVGYNTSSAKETVSDLADFARSIGSAVKGTVQSAKENPLELRQALRQAPVQATNATLVNAPEMLLRKVNPELHETLFPERDSAAARAVDTVSSMVGTLAPGAGAYRLARLIPGIAATGRGTTTAARVGEAAREGAVAGGIYSAAEIGAQEAIQPEDRDWKENLTLAGLNIGLGGGLDAGGRYLGELLSRGRQATSSGLDESLIPDSSNVRNMEFQQMPETPSQPQTVSDPSLIPDVTSSRSSGFGTMRPSDSIERALREIEGLGQQQQASTPEPKVVQAQQRMNEPDFEPMVNESDRVQFDRATNNNRSKDYKRASQEIDKGINRPSFSSRMKDKKERAIASMKNSYGYFVDRKNPILKVENALMKQGVGSSPYARIMGADNKFKPGEFYMATRRMPGVTRQAQQFAEDRMVPAYDLARQNGYNADDLNRYLLARHARTLMHDKGFEAGVDMPESFTPENIDVIIREFEGTPLDDSARMIQEMNNDLLDMLEDLKGPELVQTLKERYPDYMPFMRNIEELDKFVNEFAGQFGRWDGNSSPIKALQGKSTASIDDPIENLFRNIQATHMAYERNRMLKHLQKLAELDTDGKFVVRVTDKNRKKFSDKNIFPVYNNGELSEFAVTDSMAEVLQSGNEALINIQNSLADKILRTPTSFVRSSMTSTVNFMYRQLIRDTGWAYTVGNFSAVKDYPWAVLDVISNGKIPEALGQQSYYKEFLRRGGGSSSLEGMERTTANRRTFGKMQERVRNGALRSAGIRVINPLNFLDNLRLLNERSDMFPKVAQFKASLRKSGNTLENASDLALERAAFEGRDIMDFSRTGSGVQITQGVVPFLNSTIQGLDKTMRAFRDRPLQTTAKAIMTGTVPTLLAYGLRKTMASDDQEQAIKNSPDWLRDTHLLMPSLVDNEEIWAMPKYYDISYPFMTAVEKALEQIEEEGQVDPMDIILDMMKYYAGNVPLENPIISGVYGLYSNHDRFTGREIVPQRMQDWRPEDQTDVYTSAFADKMGEILGASPKMIDYAIQQFGGSMSQTPLAIGDVLAGKEQIRPESRQFDWNPFTRNIVRSTRASYSPDADYLYAMQKELRNQKREYEEMNVPFPYENMYTFVNRQVGVLGDIQRNIRDIQENPEISPLEKDVMIDNLVKERNQIVHELKEAGIITPIDEDEEIKAAFENLLESAEQE